MKINLFILSEAAIPDQTGKIMAGAPILFFSFPSIPWSFTFSIVFGVTGIDTNAPHDLKITIKNPDNEILLEQQANLPPQLAPIRNEDGIYSILSSIDVRNFLFSKKGKYKFVLQVDDQSEVIDLDVTKQVNPSQ